MTTSSSAESGVYSAVDRRRYPFYDPKMPGSANANFGGAGRWASLAALGQEPHLSEAEKNPGPSALGTEQVVALGALCEFSADAQEDGGLSFFVTEFFKLDDGKVINVDHRGFHLGPIIGGRTKQHSAEHESVDSLVQLVLNTVLPDDDDVPEDHPWEWLARCARGQGVHVTADELRALEYRVVLSDQIHAWLERTSAQP